jgi:hypothetical protein
MARDHVPAEFIIRLERALEVDPSAQTPVAEPRDGECFLCGKDVEPVLPVGRALVGYGEANTLAHDRCTQVDAFGVINGSDAQAAPIVAGIDLKDRADIGNNAGKHS